MSFFDSLFGNKKEKERLERERLAEQERMRLAEERRIAEERERRLAENRRKEEERLARQRQENSSKYQILDFYLDCSHWRQQNEILKKAPLALPVKRIDVDNDDDTVMQYQVRSLPKLILVDFNGKEIKRWKGVTESSEINDFLYENGYAKRPASNHKSPNSVESFLGDVKRIDTKLASQFMVESMTSDLGYEPYTELSEDFNISGLKTQYSHYCMMAKTNLVLDSMGHPNPMMSALKAHLLAYLSDPSNRTNQAMKYLYELEDRKLLIQQLGMLTLHATMKRVNDISNISNEEFRNALNLETVALGLGMYVYFTILANPSVSEEDFNELFVESWIEYFGNFQARLFMLRMRGNSWKNDFSGVLMAD